MSEYSMPSYFQTMPVIGKEVAHFSEENAAQIQEVEQEIHEIREAALEAGRRVPSSTSSMMRCIAVHWPVRRSTRVRHSSRFPRISNLLFRFKKENLI